MAGAQHVVTKGDNQPFQKQQSSETEHKEQDKSSIASRQLLKRQNGTAKIRVLSVDYAISVYDDGYIFINMIAKSTAKFYSRFSLEITLKDSNDERLHTIITPLKDVKVGSTEQYNEEEQIPAALANEVDAIEVGGQEGGSGLANEGGCIIS